MARMLWRKAAAVLGMTQHELYCGLRSGKLPGYRAGGPRGRWIVDTELIEARIEELMLANVRNEMEGQGRGIRQVD